MHVSDGQVRASHTWAAVPFKPDMASMPAPVVAPAQVDAAREAAAGVGLDPAIPEVAIAHVELAGNAPFGPKGVGKIALEGTAVALLAELTETKWVAAGQ